MKTFLLAPCSLLFAIMSCACSPKEAVVALTPPPFIYRHGISPTPIPDAANRYTAFELRIRKKDASSDTVFAPRSVRPTADGSVQADFEVILETPEKGAAYTVITAYKLDGKIITGSPDTKVLVR